jgi:hypothetical protein
MPLMPGLSQKTISGNIGELIRDYKKNGKIGTSNPKNMKKARAQAVAIAHSAAKR